MRLLNVDTYTFTDFVAVQPPPYAIASHRWVAGTEAMWEDVQQKKGTSRAGYRKLQGFVEYVKAQVPLVKWLWIDTCCIKQQSDREVSEAINSMFRWYRDAEVCLAYLEDVTMSSDAANFESSVWFKRGWTLQELLAPVVVIFLSKDWQVIGHKGRSGHGRSGMSVQTGPSLEERIAVATKIPEIILQDYEESRDLSSEEKLAWIADRNTTRGEDLAYCLLGILDVNMNVRYGDGREKTWARLLEKISKGRKLIAGTPHNRYHIPFSLKGIPFTDFLVPREADMQHLASFFRSPATAQRQRVFIVHGMGGTGKTQLCIEFARTHHEQFSAVFWLDGSSRDALKQSLVGAALRLPISTVPSSTEGSRASEDSVQLSEGFLQWLSLPDNKDWLLIFDNVDREWQSIAEDPQAYDYSEFLPRSGHGNVLVTTRLARLRRPNASLGLVSVEDNLAREMMESRAGERIQDIAMLLPKLGGLPLALAQAGSYLGVTGMTVPEYIRSYDETWADLMRYQNQFPLREYAERSVLATWKMSYEQVKNADPLAARLLDLWAFLNHGDMWVELVLVGKGDAAQCGLSGEDALLQATKLSLQHSVGILVQYSMVTTGTGAVWHSIHPVVHAWCRYNLESTTAEQQLLSTALHFVAAMIRALPKSVPRETSLRLAAHARTVGERVGMLARNKGVTRTCFEVATFLMKWEKSAIVEALYLRALDGCENSTSAGRIATQDIVNCLGVLYAGQGKMAEAERMYIRALQAKDMAWSREHTSILDTVTNLGHLYPELGEVADAEAMYIRALRGREKALGEEHTSTLGIFANLGIIYTEQAKFAQAEAVTMRALRGMAKALGEEQTETLNILHNLGILYARQERFAEAEETFMRVIRGKQKGSGQEDSSIVETLHNLGVLYVDQGRTEEAEEVYMKALRCKEEAWGTAHRSTLDTVKNIGNLYMRQRRLADAGEMYRRALQGYYNLPYPPQAEMLDLENVLCCLQNGKGESGSRLQREIEPYSGASLLPSRFKNSNNDFDVDPFQTKCRWKAVKLFRRRRKPGTTKHGHG